ncbi:MAG TPA: hypothetical protein VEO54_23285 [Thermoanaerobaculia bacterium]|nr:hypothetical protein [Thermoanaerobaculia bacterium]
MRRLPAVFLALLTSVSLFAAIVPGPERPVAPPEVGTSFAVNRLETTATDGTDFLILWTEETPGRDGLYATVVLEDGTAAPQAKTPIARGKVFSTRAVWAGDAYLAIATVNQVTMLMRLDRDGQLLSGPTPFEIEGSVGAMAWNGRYVLVTTFAASRATATLLDSQGRVVRSGITLPRAGSAVVPATNAFVVFLYSTTTLEAVRVTEDGTVTAPATIVGQQYAQMTYDVASSGNRVAIAVRAGDGTSFALHRFLLDAKTLALETRPVLELPQFTSWLQVVRSPGGFTAAWSYLEDGGRTALLGSVDFDSSTPRALAVPHQMPWFELESNGRNTLAAWGGAPVRGMGFDAAVTRGRSGVIAIAEGGVRQSLLSMAASPDATLAVWGEDNGYNRADVMVRRFDREGNALGQPLRIATNAWSPGNTAVAFTGRGWLVAWMVGTNAMDMHIYVRPLALDGTPLYGDPLDAGPGWYPALGSNGKVTLLGMNTEGNKAMAVLRFSPDGERLDPQPAIVFNDRGLSPAIATNGRELLMVWESAPRTYPNPFGILGARFGENGTLLDTTPIRIATTELQESAPHVASDGTDFLVVYARAFFQYEDLTPFTPTLHAKRLLRTGVLADATAEDPGPYLGTGGLPHVAPLGAGYAVTFARSRDAGQDAWPISLYAMRVDLRGEVVEGARTLPNGESYSPQHALVSAGDAVLLAYPRVEPSLGNAQRIYLRTLEEEAAPRRRAVRR